MRLFHRRECLRSITSMAIIDKGGKAISLTDLRQASKQKRFIPKTKIVITPTRVQKELDDGKAVIVSVKINRQWRRRNYW